MKRNALIRMILWSLVIFILTTLMVGVGFGISFNRTPRITLTEQPATVAPTEAVRPNTDYGTTAIVTANAVNVRQAPNSGSSVVGLLEKGTTVIITRTESVDGTRWSYITTPCAGWIQAEYLETPKDTDIIPQETVIPSQSNGYGCPAADIRELEIQWATGDIKIYPANTDRITVSENGTEDDRYAMLVRQDKDTLEIQFCQKEYNLISLNKLPEKDLTVYVPADWYCESLEIDAAAAAVEVNDLTIGEVDFDGASGVCEFENCTVEEIDIDTASGDVRFVGSLNILDCDAASASFYASLTNVPSRMDMDMMSGNLDLTLPADAGFSLRMDTMNDNFSSEFQTELKNGNYVAGNGACRINIDALSGDVTIRKAI